MKLTINRNPETLRSDELLIELINRGEVKIPHVCYHPELGPNQKQLHKHGAFELLGGALSASAWVVADSYRGVPWLAINKR